MKRSAIVLTTAISLILCSCAAVVLGDNDVGFEDSFLPKSSPQS